MRGLLPLPCQPLLLAGSPYNDMAYCEQFPRVPSSSSNDSGVPAPEYWGQVGKSNVPRSNFDNIGWALFTVFQVLTAENWNNVMYSGMTAISPWTCLFFVLVVIVGNYMLLNLFLAGEEKHIIILCKIEYIAAPCQLNPTQSCEPDRGSVCKLQYSTYLRP